MKISLPTPIILTTLACFLLLSCGTLRTEPVKELFFGADQRPTPSARPMANHSRAAANEALERALLTPDRATAAAFIRTAIGFLR